MTSTLVGGPLDEPLGFASHESLFMDETGVRLNGHGLWPFFSGDEHAGATFDEPFWISYGSSSLRGRSDLLHVGIAGVKHRDRSARLTTAGAPGERLQIVPEPSNPVNSAALAIHTTDMRYHLGYVYDDDLTDVRNALGQGWFPLSAWEWRYDNGERCAMHALVVHPQYVEQLIATARSAPI